MLIEDTRKEDKGLLEHGLVHSKQFYRTIGTWGLLNCFKKYRYNFELEAYT